MSRNSRVAALRALEPIAAWRDDCDRIARLESAFTRALEAGDVAEAQALFAKYRSSLERHLAHEEDATFPEAERRAPSQGGPIRSLRVAHMRIREDLAQIDDLLGKGLIPAVRPVWLAFRDGFAAHERLEDQLVDLLLQLGRDAPPG